MDDDKQIDVLVMDFSKAFDKVSHYLIIHKLKHYGIRGKVNKWIKSFLLGRTQTVVAEGEHSSYLPVDSGVLLGPSLSLYYINDIPTGLDSTIRLFADDTIVYLVIKSNSDALNMQRDLDKLAVGTIIIEDGFPPGASFYHRTPQNTI